MKGKGLIALCLLIFLSIFVTFSPILFSYASFLSSFSLLYSISHFPCFVCLSLLFFFLPHTLLIHGAVLRFLFLGLRDLLFFFFYNLS